MKKNYFFGALLSLMFVLFALPAKAQVSSIADLFGKYQFTADMEVMAGMEAKAEQLSANCEAVIESDPIYDAHIVGFAGSTETMYINAISTEKEMIKVTNRNTPQLFDGLYLSDETGRYPYAIWEGGTEVEAALGALYMSYNPTTKEITVPDFTIVTCDHSTSTSTVIAKFTNAKFTLVEETVIEIADLSGSWHAKAGAGQYDSMTDSEYSTEYDFVLTKTSEDNKNYSVELTIDKFAPVTTTATFDGVTLVINCNNIVLDETSKVGIYDFYSGASETTIEFNYASENTLTMSYSLALAIPGVDAEENPTLNYVQYYMNGNAKRGSGDEEVDFSWVGTWTVKATENMTQTPAEFNMVIEYHAEWQMYLITEFLGHDVNAINYGGILIEPAADGKSATIETGVLIESLGEGNFSHLYDANMGTEKLNVTVNADGTLSIENFSIATNAYGAPAADAKITAYYVDVTASMPTAEEEVEFDWTGSWDVKATENMAQVPAEFTMVVEKLDDGMGGFYYCIKEFMGADTYTLNYGGFEIIPAADGKSATITSNCIVKSLGEGNFSYIYDTNMGTEPINVTVNADGSLSIENFSIATNAYGAPSADAKITAYYVDVTASKPAAEEEVEFDWTGSWNVKATENMAQVPAEFTMVVEKLDDGMGGFFYCIKEFMGADTYTLNYGGFEIIPAADGKSATIKSNSIVKSLGEGNFSYIYDANMGTDPINVTVNADGTLSIDNFSIATNAYGAAAADAKITAYYVDVTASKGVADAIESVQTTETKVSVAGGVITIAGDAQDVQVYDAAGRLEFSGIASSVSNLTKGIHIVKVGGAAVKVSVR